MQEEYIDLKELLNIVKHGWKIILGITIVFTLVSFTYTKFFITPQYQVESKIFIGKDDEVNSAYNNSEVNMYQDLMYTYKEILISYDLVDRAINKTEYDYSTSSILDLLNVRFGSNTQVLTISLEHPEPKVAKEILDEVIDEFITTSKKLIPNGNVVVLEKTRIPEYPVSPNVLMNTVIGLILGLMLSVFLLFALEFIRNTVKTEEQLHSLLDIPVLAVIPNTDKVK